MMNTTPKDYLGKPIVEGSTVVILHNKYQGFVKALVLKINPKTVTVRQMCKSSNQPEQTVRTFENVIVIG